LIVFSAFFFAFLHNALTHLLAFADASVQDTGHERPLGCQRWLGNQAGQENQRGGEAGLLAGYTNLLADGLTGRFVLSFIAQSVRSKPKPRR